MIDSLLDPGTLYSALLARDPAYDGHVFVGVTTTGVFCRLTCPARKPKFRNTRFFDSARACQDAGFRPCLRCRPLLNVREREPLVSMLLAQLNDDPDRAWSDDDLTAMSLDPSTVRRAFRRQMGITFLDLARLRRMGRGLDRLAVGTTVIDAQIEAGFASGSGFRDAVARLIGDSPATLQGREVLRADWIETPIGSMLAVGDEHAVLLEFFDRKALPAELTQLRSSTGFSIAFGRTPSIDQVAEELNAYFVGRSTLFTTPLALRGSPFTRKVWDALQAIPVGTTRSYGQIAAALGRTSAARAVARANGANQIAIMIPCHRVIGSDGHLTGYGGKLWRKALADRARAPTGGRGGLPRSTLSNRAARAHRRRRYDAAGPMREVEREEFSDSDWGPRLPKPDVMDIRARTRAIVRLLIALPVVCVVACTASIASSDRATAVTGRVYQIPRDMYGDNTEFHVVPGAVVIVGPEPVRGATPPPVLPAHDVRAVTDEDGVFRATVSVAPIVPPPGTFDPPASNVPSVVLPASGYFVEVFPPGADGASVDRRIPNHAFAGLRATSLGTFRVTPASPQEAGVLATINRSRRALHVRSLTSTRTHSKMRDAIRFTASLRAPFVVSIPRRTTDPPRATSRAAASASTARFFTARIRSQPTTHGARRCSPSKRKRPPRRRNRTVARFSTRAPRGSASASTRFSVAASRRSKLSAANEPRPTTQVELGGTTMFGRDAFHAFVGCVAMLGFASCGGGGDSTTTSTPFTPVAAASLDLARAAATFRPFGAPARRKRLAQNEPWRSTKDLRSNRLGNAVFRLHE